MEAYNKKVMEYFTNPRNIGKIENASGIGNVGNPQCGDMMRLYIKVENDIIVDAKFKTFGCGAAIASSSILTELVKGKHINEAISEKMDDRVIEELGGLPPIKRHCSVLADQALKAAIEDYKKRASGTKP